MTTFNIDHKDGKVRLGVSGEKIEKDFNVEQLWIELEPKEALDIAYLLSVNAVSAIPVTINSSAQLFETAQ